MTGDLDDDRAAAVGRLIELGLDRAAASLGAAGTVHRDPVGGTMQPLDQLDRLGPLLADVVTGIRRDQLDAPTPCADFTVRGVLDHMVGGASAFTAAFGGEAPEAPAGESLDALLPTLGGLVAAMHAPGALDRTIAAPFGDVDGESFARFVVLDGLVHGWDLATATGQAYAPTDELVAAVDGFARGALDPLRDGTTFAKATDAPADATPIERLAAYTGRTVPR